ncbi:excinuclease ABC subunit B, partial [Candidatus Roizmanbacteria bacterium CG10_big_fil_rev_8_21_14_0_10_45_7]
NLLREGLDLPEVTLVAILDADREGFLRSKTAFIQIMGRAARNARGRVIIYSDAMTGSLSGAIDEVRRRRQYQVAYNKKHNITPQTIHKPIRERLMLDEDVYSLTGVADTKRKYNASDLDEISAEGLTAYDKKKLVTALKRQMKREADNLNFEVAAAIRDKVRQLEQ